MRLLLSFLFCLLFFHSTTQVQQWTPIVTSDAVAVVECAPICYCNGGPAFGGGYSKSELLALNNDDLYQLGLSGINDCVIVESPVGSGAFCDIYVKVKGIGGYPLNIDCEGTGCVKAPDYPRGMSTCWYARDEYCPEISEVSSDFCTESGVANAAAQLRRAIENDHCNCDNLKAPPPPTPPCPHCHCEGEPASAGGYSKSQLLALDDTTLYQLGLSGINDCMIQLAPVGTSNACDLYVTVTGTGGYPLNADCDGTGCVYAPDFPREMSICWYARDEYCPEIQAVSNTFCTGSGVANAAAQLRHAIENDHCNCKT